jgi:hypothetical protein
MKLVASLLQQTVFDIALQEMGHAEAVFEILIDNETLTLSTELSSGQQLVINHPTQDQSIVDTYQVNQTKPGNGLSLTIQVLGTADGKAIKTNTGKYIKIKIKK